MFFNDEEEKKPLAPDDDFEPDSEAEEWRGVDLLVESVDSGVTKKIDGCVTAEFDMGTMISPALMASFSILAPAWEVTESECTALGEAWGSCFELWFPDSQLSPKYAALGTAVLTTAMVVAPRMGKPKKEVKEVADGVRPD